MWGVREERRGERRGESVARERWGGMQTQTMVEVISAMHLSVAVIENCENQLTWHVRLEYKTKRSESADARNLLRLAEQLFVRSNEF